MPLVQVQQGEPFKHCNRSAFLLSETRLKLRGKGGGKGREAPPVAEEANKVWRSGWLFARIRTEKDGNCKRMCDTAHDAVGSSGAGGNWYDDNGGKIAPVCSVGDFLRKRLECLLVLFQR